MSTEACPPIVEGKEPQAERQEARFAVAHGAFKPITDKILKARL
jgi:hypothetical protein